jgi:outer membrane receptor for monomeric catechols
MAPTGSDNMADGMLRRVTVALVAVCFAGEAFAVEGARPHHAAKPIPGSVSSPRSRDTRLSPLPSQSTLDTPGQVTVLTREVLDDKNATSLRDALGTTAGVTVGR